MNRPKTETAAPSHHIALPCSLLGHCREMKMPVAQVKLLCVFLTPLFAHTPETMHRPALLTYAFRYVLNRFISLHLSLSASPELLQQPPNSSLCTPTPGECPQQSSFKLMSDHITPLLKNAPMVPSVNSHLSNNLKPLDMGHPSIPLYFSDLICCYSPVTLNLILALTH